MFLLCSLACLCVADSGKVLACGGGDFAQAGQSRISNTMVPEIIAALSEYRVVQVAAGYSHSGVILGTPAHERYLVRVRSFTQRACTACRCCCRGREFVSIRRGQVGQDRIWLRDRCRGTDVDRSVSIRRRTHPSAGARLHALGRHHWCVKQRPRLGVPRGTSFIMWRACAIADDDDRVRAAVSMGRWRAGTARPRHRGEPRYAAAGQASLTTCRLASISRPQSHGGAHEYASQRAGIAGISRSLIGLLSLGCW